MEMNSMCFNNCTWDCQQNEYRVKQHVAFGNCLMDPCQQPRNRTWMVVTVDNGTQLDFGRNNFANL